MSGTVIALMVAAAAVALVIPLARRRAGGRHREGPPLRVEGLSGPLDVYDMEWEDGRPVRVLATGRTLQSAVYLDDSPYDPVFEYYVLYDLMFEGSRPIRNVLLMGGGGYAYPQYLLHAHPEVSMDVVELDPVVTHLAERYFGLGRLEREVGLAPQGRLGLYEGDARAFLQQATTCYDAILNDCFSGNVPASSLATVEAARLVRTHLQPGGVFLSNVVSALEGPHAGLLRALARTYSQVFRYVYVVPAGRNPADRSDNNLLVATDVPFSFPVAREVTFSQADPIITDADNPTERLVSHL